MANVNPWAGSGKAEVLEPQNGLIDGYFGGSGVGDYQYGTLVDLVTLLSLLADQILLNYG